MSDERAGGLERVARASGAGPRGGSPGDDLDKPRKEKPKGFRWLVKGKLAGMARISEGNQDQLRARCRWLAEEGFKTIVSIERNGAGDTRDAWRAIGKEKGDRNLAWFETFLYDWNAPSARQLASFVRLVERRKRLGAVAVHCSGGTGRTGCFLAAHQMYKNNSGRWNARQAVSSVRRLYNRESVELWTQYNALARYGDILNNRVRSDPFDKDIGMEFNHGHQSGIAHDPGHSGDEFARDTNGRIRTINGHPLRTIIRSNRDYLTVSEDGTSLSNPPYCTPQVQQMPRGIP